MYILQSAQEIKSSAKHLLDCNEVSTHSRPDRNSRFKSKAFLRKVLNHKYSKLICLQFSTVLIDEANFIATDLCIAIFVIFENL